MNNEPKAEWRQALRGEPTLPELLHDPIVALLMDRDGVSYDDLRALVRHHRSKID